MREQGKFLDGVVGDALPSQESNSAPNPGKRRSAKKNAALASKQQATPDRELPVPSELSALFEFSDLMPNEQPELYSGILQDFVRVISPRDIIESMLLKRAVDHELDIRRCQRMMTLLIGSEIPVEMPVVEVEDRLEAWAIAGGFAPKRSVEEQALIDEERKIERENRRREHQEDFDRKRSPEGVAAALMDSFKLNASHYELLNRLLELSEQRRTSALQGISRHRASLADSLKSGATDITDAEFKEEPPMRKNSKTR